jgi:hypothetical protein
MAYYIISFEPEQMKLFQKRYEFLDDAIWINEKKDLAKIISSPLGDAYFFVHLTNNREAIDEIVLIIRDNLRSAKIIYVSEDPKAVDLKAHQMTPVGGDGYVSMQVDTSQLFSMLEGLIPHELNQRGNRLESGSNNVSAQQGLAELRNNPKNQELEKVFAEVFGKKVKKANWQKASDLVSVPTPDEDELEAGDDMSDKDQELSLDDLGDLEITSEGVTETQEQEESGLDFDLGDDVDLELSDSDEGQVEEEEDSPAIEPIMELDLGLDFGSNDAEAEPLTATPDLSLDDDLGFSLDDGLPDAPDLGEDLALDNDVPALDFDIGGDDAASDELSLSDDLSLDENSSEFGGDIDLSDDAKEKLKEIDAIMDFDASQVGIKVDLSANEDNDDIGLSLSDDSDIDTSLVSDDLDLGSISFSQDEEAELKAAPVQEVKSKKKPKENKEVKESYDGSMGRDFKEISGAYTGEMERMQATISNLRSDREELLAKIQQLEEDRTLQNRQTLTMRAELDEKKIELSIIRKKLNDEVSEVRDRLKLFEEKKIILEEKNRLMAVELDKTAHKNKIDVKKVQMRERELEQKLELLKADSESQIRHRDLKILELKRKLDAMEFDIESISVQEKRSVESRFELEDKLDKALKTLRNAITVLEDESENRGTLDALKKNIDM